MSTESPAQAASADVARVQAQLSSQLGLQSLPELRSILGMVKQELGSGGMPQQASDVFDRARGDVNRGYAQAGTNMQGLLQQQAQQSGQRFLGGQVQAASQGYGIGLEQDHAQALRSLQMQQSQAGLGQYNQLLNLLGQGSGAALNLGRGFSGNQIGAIGGMSQGSQAGGALSGAAGGASIGTSIYPGWGTAVGAVVGGAAGYLSSG